MTLITVALVCFELLPTAYAVRPTPSPSPTPSPGENLGNGNSAAENVQALISLTTGVNNTATGFQALYSNTTGVDNTANGDKALFSNTIGSANNAVGSHALFANVTGEFNNAVGGGALYFNTNGMSNNAFGDGALYYNTTGENNTAVGDLALTSNTTGNGNVAIGSQSLYWNTTGLNNTAIGVFAGAGVATASNVICIGTAGADVSDSCYIGQIFGQSSPSGTAVFVNSDGKLGTTVSSRRFKDDIKPMDKASEAILALKPVTFRYKHELDPKGIPQFGLVAEQVEKVNPDLVIRDDQGKPYTVRYEAVNAMLLNEFLKQHRKVETQECEIEAQNHKAQEHEATIVQLKTLAAQQQKQIEALTVGLQKVSNQLELSKSAPQMVVANDQ